jgi:hypothetical protein
VEYTQAGSLCYTKFPVCEALFQDHLPGRSTNQRNHPDGLMIGFHLFSSRSHRAGSLKNPSENLLGVTLSGEAKAGRPDSGGASPHQRRLAIDRTSLKG